MNARTVAYACACLGILAILGLTIAITVGVFGGSGGSVAASGGEMMAGQPTMCDDATTPCTAPETCCHGICRDPDTFNGPCLGGGAPTACSLTGIACLFGEFCCTPGTSTSGFCRPVDWPGKCKSFAPIPIGRCDDATAQCPSPYACCKGFCRAAGHPAC